MSAGAPTHGRPWSRLDPAVEVLAPETQGRGFSAFLDDTLAAIPNGSRPGAFAEPRIDALNALSSAFLRDATLRQDPASVAVAYWMRRAQTSRMKSEFERRVAAETSVVRVPVGRVFHVAPSNVDTMFLYSWALAFLCGNANVVRVSQDRGPIVTAMLQVLQRAARDHDELRERNRFVTYAHDAEVTTAISWWCSHRVIWGGNDTVAGLRPLALNPHASERVFGSKFSYSVFSAARWLAAGEEERAKTAASFFNDLFWFDQMACSSPHVVFWRGAERETNEAIDALEAALQGEIDRRGYVPAAASAVHRRAYAFEMAADTDVSVELAHPGFVGVRVHESRGLTRETCGGGLIRHYRIDRLDELASYAGEADQTVTHYGLERDEVTALAAELGPRGVDRIVPVGQALAFDEVWDGFDLVDDFTRRVRVTPV